MKREKRWRRKSLSTTLKRETNEEQEREKYRLGGGEDGQCEEKCDRRADNKLSRVADRQVRVNEQTLKNS